jgi:hypothetical protein
MITRREVVLGGALMILFGTAYRSLAEIGNQTGCLLSGAEAKRLLAATADAQLFFPSREPVIRSSGNRDLDYALAQTLAMVAEKLNVLPGFAFYDDYDGKNAYATPERILMRSDGTVLFGIRLLRFLLAQGEHPEAAVAMVCAHEFGHVVQFRGGLIRTLQGWDPTVRRVELHADFLAGFFAGLRKVQRPSFPALVFAEAAHQGGDFATRNPNHHGTPTERAAAIVQGFQTAFRDHRTTADAINIGVNYVRSI